MVRVPVSARGLLCATLPNCSRLIGRSWEARKSINNNILHNNIYYYYYYSLYLFSLEDHTGGFYPREKCTQLIKFWW